MSQLPMFATNFANRLHARTLARREDADTSHLAAIRLVESGQLTAQQGCALGLFDGVKSGTSWELARGKADLHYMLARRLPELERKGLVRVQRDVVGRERTVKRSRMWEALP